MRLWSIHPSYLDAKGIVALWREGLLAKKVLEGKTRGYKNHPQLLRFKKHKNKLHAIESFLECVLEESKKRGYNFNSKKIKLGRKVSSIYVTIGQAEYEVMHLKAKLKKRDPKRLKNLPKKKAKLNHIFRYKVGDVEEWEKI